MIAMTGTTAAAPLARAQQPQEPNAQEPASLVTSPLVLMAPRADGIEAVWSVSRPARGWVEWQSADGAHSGKVAETAYGLVPQGDRCIRVRIDGLKPGAAYKVRSITIASDTQQRIESEWKAFTCLSPKAKAARFVVWNDTHQNEETLKRLATVTAPADFLLWNGDTCNNWDQEDWVAPTLLNPGGQDMSKDHPMFLVWGNHDVRGKWAFKVEEFVATPDGRPFYAFRQGPIACICLHTGEDKPDDHPSFGGRVAFEALRAEQAKWLEQVIQRPEFRDAPFRVVFCHIPLRWKEEKPVDYAKGGYDNYSLRSRNLWHASLVKWKTQVVISGHTHEAAWLPATQEFPYAQLVGGGPKPKAATWLEGAAEGGKLKLTTRDLDGKVLLESEFKALS